MSNRRTRLDRRCQLRLSAAAPSMLIAGAAAAQDRPAYSTPTTVDTGQVRDSKVVFPPGRDAADPNSAPTPAPLPPDQRVGYAIVGLGRLSLGELLPAFGECKKARLVALVSGSAEKLRLTAAQYGIAPEACYDYAGFDRIADNPEIQVVYIVLPNGMHREYVERAAAAGKHVL